jgi:hypothetical protein
MDLFITCKKAKPWFFIILFLFTSCRQKYLWFTELQGVHNADRNAVLRIYFDRYGDIYPGNGLYINNRDFLPEKNRNGINSARLESYFTLHPAYLQNLASLYQYPLSSDPAADYKQLQEKIMGTYKIQFQQLIKTYQTKRVVVFIHGFNDPNPTGAYQELRNFIRSERHDEHHEYLYIEIYWDGLTANSGNPGTAGIWGKAQFNSRYVCLGLRTLINRLNVPPTLPMTIITHSLGASVGTGFLFNTRSKWKDGINSPVFKEIKTLSEEPTPSMRIRLGMLAPAIPGLATFEDILNRPTVVEPSKDNIERIVTSVNKHDYALIKGFSGESQFLAPHVGATTLGSDYRNEAKKVRDCLNKIYQHPINEQQYTIIPFTTERIAGTDNQEHGLHYYLQDQAAMHDFIKALFDN